MKYLELNGDVGTSITVDKVKSFLAENKNEEITFKIFTPGGNIDDGIAIHNEIKQHAKRTVAEITAHTASAGTIIALACDRVEMYSNVLFLIHNSWTKVEGNVYDLQKAATSLAKNDKIMVDMYKDKTGLADAQIVSLMKKQDWLTAEEAVKYGFVDFIKQAGSKIAASVKKGDYVKYLNNTLLIKLQNKMKVFNKKGNTANSVAWPLALKDGTQLIMSEEAVAENVEVAPLGAATLEDGEYVLLDGRKIVVVGGVITEVMEAEEAPASEETEAVLDTVAEMLSDSEKKIDELVEAKMKVILGKITSAHKPVKSSNVSNQVKSEADAHDEAVEAKKAELKEKVATKRKGGV